MMAPPANSPEKQSGYLDISGMPQHTPEKFHLSNSYSSYDLSLELKNRRRSLDIGFTDGFFAEPPKSLNSSTSGGSVSTDRKEQLLQAIGQCKKMLKQNQHDEKLKGLGNFYL